MLFLWTGKRCAFACTFTRSSVGSYAHLLLQLWHGRARTRKSSSAGSCEHGPHIVPHQGAHPWQQAGVNSAGIHLLWRVVLRGDGEGSTQRGRQTVETVCPYESCMRSCCIWAPGFSIPSHVKAPWEYTPLKTFSNKPSSTHNPSPLLTWHCMPMSSGQLTPGAHLQCPSTHRLAEVTRLALLHTEMQRSQGKKTFFFCGGSQLYRDLFRSPPPFGGLIINFSLSLSRFREREKKKKDELGFKGTHRNRAMSDAVTELCASNLRPGDAETQIPYPSVSCGRHEVFGSQPWRRGCMVPVPVCPTLQYVLVFRAGCW